MLKATIATYVQEHPATYNPFVVHFIDAIFGRAKARDRRYRVPVIQLAVLINMRKRVPLGTGLERHDNVVVRRACGSFNPALSQGLLAGPTPANDMIRHIGIAAVYGHKVNRIVSKAAAALMAISVDIYAEREYPPFLDQVSNQPDLFLGDKANGPQFVVGTPAASVADAECKLFPIQPAYCPLYK